MSIKSKNLSPNAEFAKQFFVTPVILAAGTTLSTASVGAIILPFRSKVEAVTVRTLQTSAGGVIDVREGGTSILSAAITAATTASTNVSGTVSDSDIAASAVLDVTLTRGNADACYYSVMVQFRPYLGSPERVGKSLADES